MKAFTLSSSFAVSEKTYNLPPNPEVPTVYLKRGWQSAAIGSAMLAVGAFFAFLGGRK